jgi:hypothetical protein
MLLLRKSEPTNVVVTVTELVTEPTTDFLFVFRNIQSNEEVNGTFENLSSSPETYDEFEINLNFPNTGQYLYEVYQPSNLKLLETGMALVQDDQSPTDEYTHDFTFKIYE